MTLTTPSFEEDISRHLDWLELSALLSCRAVVRLDELENSFEIEEDEDSDNFGKDSRIEDFRTRAAAQVDYRRNSLREAYPFSISKNGEEITYNGNDNIGRVAYSISLIVEHSWPGGLLQRRSRMTSGEAQKLRRAFEILSAVALAGLAQGPSFLIGTNRAGAVALLDRIKIICDRAQDGRQRAAPLEDAPIHANDDGVDVIALALEANGPPPRAFLFGQCASGQDWKGKSIKVEIMKFVRNWFEIPPACDLTPVMLVPRLPDKSEALQQTQRLGHLVHRLRLPSYVYRAAQTAANRVDLIDCWESRGVPLSWLDGYLKRMGVKCEAT